jgi:hypothetical protein
MGGIRPVKVSVVSGEENVGNKRCQNITRRLWISLGSGPKRRERVVLRLWPTPKRLPLHDLGRSVATAAWRKGSWHVLGCDMERCPFCAGQLLWCNCDHPPSEAELEGKRHPFIEYPPMCAKCGEPWPDLFMVPDEEWARYVEPWMRKEVISFNDAKIANT